MNLAAFFGLLGGLLVLAFVANLLVLRTGIPDALVLMATGVLLGPLLHVVDPSKFQGVTEGFGTLALILILFEAGLELDLWQTVRHFYGGLVLAIFSYAASVLLIVLVARETLALPLRSALIVGAVLGGVSSSVTLPVLQHLGLRPKARITLLIEASLADIFSILSVAALLDIGTSGGSVIAGLLRGFYLELGISLALGVAAGIGWSFLLPALSDRRFWQVLSFGAVLLVYAGTAVAGGGPLLAVLIFGLTLTNAPEARKRLTPATPLPTNTIGAEPHVALLAFHAELSFLVRTFFFVLVGVAVSFSAFSRQWVAVAWIFAAILAARGIAVYASRLAWRNMHPWERELAFWLLPRGLITVVLALEVVRVLGGGWNFLLDLAFAAIVLTNLCLMIATVRVRAHTQIAEITSVAPPEAL
ncbi:MAG TPA: cation:proton antiporter [Patescibacteria group bacterium]|nr:cation:proton antiporter [Patescibacteria group bacterium]